MTDLAWVLLAAAGAAAVGDWLAVAAATRTLEYVCKPAAIGLLLAVAVVLQPRHDAQRWAFVAALVLSLAGDVALMLRRFLPGLAAFFGAHLAYIVGLRAASPGIRPLVVAAVIVLVPIALLGRRVLAGVRTTDPDLGTPVSLYIAAISVMLASALAAGNALVATGAVLFVVSDSLIAWNRFVEPLPWAPVTIMVTYHLGQAGLVTGLAL